LQLAACSLQLAACSLQLAACSLQLVHENCFIKAETNMTTIDVAVAVVMDTDRRVLITRRHPDVHQGGKWEFPGGKRESGESILSALQRELHEELGISIHPETCQPLIRIRHVYPEKTVLLDVWSVGEFEGEPHGREGQPVEWRNIEELNPDDFPPANRAIINALRLPDRCLITPDADRYPASEFLDHLRKALDNGIRLVQFRSPALSQPGYLELARHIIELCTEYKALCQLNTSWEWFHALGSHAAEPLTGLHLNSQRLYQINVRPEEFSGYLSASCHNAADIAQANHIGVDFILLSPVKPTGSHPGATVLGWENFSELTGLAAMPVYALGGMRIDDIAQAKNIGAQGIAGISGLWPGRK
jgi:8-oxo-dGTP diphosphatase